MSHTVKAEIKIKDFDTFIAVAKEKGYSVVENTEVKLYSSRENARIAVQVSKWKYPIVVTSEGEVRYDNYNGKWGKQEVLDELLEDYAVEVVKKSLPLGFSLLSEEEKEGEKIMVFGKL